MPAGGVIVRPGRNDLDTVRSEQGKLTYVSVESLNGKGIVRIGLWPVAQLVPTDRVSGRGGDGDVTGNREPARPHVGSPQQSPYAI